MGSRRKLVSLSDEILTIVRKLATFLLLMGSAGWPCASAVTTPANSAEESMLEQNSEPLAIVVNRSNPVNNLSSAELHRIFVGSLVYWPNGRRITLVMREPADPERKTILRDVCGMTEGQLKANYLRGLYSGDMLVSPKILDTTLGVRKFIFNVPGAIGYLRLSDVDSTVKIMSINEVFPDGKGYKLHVQIQVDN